MKKLQFRNMMLATRLILSYLSVALIPFLVFAILIGSIFIRQAQQTARDYSNQMVNQVCNSIDVYISTLDKIASYITFELIDTDFFEITEKKPDSEATTRKIECFLQDIARSHEEIAGVLIASEHDIYASTNMSRISRDSFVSEDWYKQAAQSTGQILLISNATGRNIVTNQEYSVDDVFSVCKAIKTANGELLGVILFDIRHDIIKKSISTITIGEKGFIFVTDAHNNIVYTQTNNIVYRVNPQWLQLNSPITKKIKGEKYQIGYEQSGYTGWKTVGVFSLDEVMSGVNSIIYLVYTSLGITIIIVFVLALRLSRSIIRPVVKLQKLMKQAEGGDLNVQFNSQSNDEIGALGLSFNHLISRIQHLIHMVYVEQQLKRDAELKSLQEQIKPHFLYNTLDTISWLARDYDAEDIVLLVDALTSMFRVGLSQGKEIISVKEEMTHITNYLYIQKMRYKSKLNYEIDIQESLHQYMIPKLILQPLVENAIYHGIRARRCGGTIYVRAHIDDIKKSLIFSVRDNGVGMMPEKLQKLNTLLGNYQQSVDPTESKQSFGLFYIKERIRLSYGDGYGVVVDSRQGEGTTVTITVPANLR